MVTPQEESGRTYTDLETGASWDVPCDPKTDVDKSIEIAKCSIGLRPVPLTQCATCPTVIPLGFVECGECRVKRIASLLKINSPATDQKG